ncbi:hypothetical protein BC829DRAFT_282055 [Chytridium lagenaria]|nr:hypothetical protein BC829DRAFT_282055 [Chytridium lagenaria]
MGLASKLKASQQGAAAALPQQQQGQQQMYGAPPPAGGYAPPPQGAPGYAPRELPHLVNTPHPQPVLQGDPVNTHHLQLVLQVAPANTLLPLHPPQVVTLLPLHLLQVVTLLPCIRSRWLRTTPHRWGIPTRRSPARSHPTTHLHPPSRATIRHASPPAAGGGQQYGTLPASQQSGSYDILSRHLRRIVTTNQITQFYPEATLNALVSRLAAVDFSRLSSAWNIPKEIAYECLRWHCTM